jgi:hypothetical protein
MSRPTRTKVRGVFTHAKSSEEEGKEGHQEESEEESEEISFLISTAPHEARAVFTVAPA